MEDQARLKIQTEAEPQSLQDQGQDSQRAKKDEPATADTGARAAPAAPLALHGLLTSRESLGVRSSVATGRAQPEPFSAPSEGGPGTLQAPTNASNTS